VAHSPQHSGTRASAAGCAPSYRAYISLLHASRRHLRHYRLPRGTIPASVAARANPPGRSSRTGNSGRATASAFHSLLLGSLVCHPPAQGGKRELIPGDLTNLIGCILTDQLPFQVRCCSCWPETRAERSSCLARYERNPIIHARITRPPSRLPTGCYWNRSYLPPPRCRATNPTPHLPPISRTGFGSPRILTSVRPPHTRVLHSETDYVFAYRSAICLR
jgi:hypothetical protein